jgi:hypothetical protein
LPSQIDKCTDFLSIESIEDCCHIRHYVQGLLARVKVGAGKIDLADINAKFQVLKESNIATKIIASKGLTPLFA